MSNIIARQRDLASVAALFNEIDTDKDGKLSLDELKNASSELSELLSANKDDVVEVFESLDTNGSGFIEYSEFVTAVL